MHLILMAGWAHRAHSLCAQLFYCVQAMATESMPLLVRRECNYKFIDGSMQYIQTIILFSD